MSDARTRALIEARKRAVIGCDEELIELIDKALRVPDVAAEVQELPAIPDDNADFTPALARKIIWKYQTIIGNLRRQINDEPQIPWLPVATIPKGETVLAWWLNGEQHTGSTDGKEWFPAWDHQDRAWDMPQLWMPLSEPDKATAKAAQKGK